MLGVRYWHSSSTEICRMSGYAEGGGDGDDDGDSKSHTSTGSHLTTSKNRPRSDQTGISKNGQRVLLAVKVIFGIILFTLVLVCTVFSKLTLVSLTSKLRISTRCNDTLADKSCPEQISAAGTHQAVTIYWQLFFVIIIPTLLTFLRTLVFGVLGKTTKTYPWPKLWSGIAVSGTNSVCCML